MEFYPGDIGASKGKGIAAWLSKNLFWPQTDRFHYFLIGQYVPWDNDYLILESITSKGVTVGRLSWYPLEELEVYRIKDPDWQELGRRVIIEATKFGRFYYDYSLPFKLFAGAIRLIVTGHLPPWGAEALPYGKNSYFLCTELVNEAWGGVGRPIVPKGVAPLPSAFQRAVELDQLVKIFPTE